MRKKISAAILAVLALSSWAGAVTLRPGLWYGPQKIRDARIAAVYGEQEVALPYLEVQLWKGLLAGAGYEFGYERDGKIGLDRLDSTLRLSGLDLFLGYEQRWGRFGLFGKVGLGLYSYEQTIPGFDVAGFAVDHKKTTVTLSGGMTFYPVSGFFLAAEVRYVPLNVKPFESEVDLGGFRFMGGIGLAFDIY